VHDMVGQGCVRSYKRAIKLDVRISKQDRTVAYNRISQRDLQEMSTLITDSLLLNSSCTFLFAPSTPFTCSFYLLICFA
jgi:hypothetical protein